MINYSLRDDRQYARPSRPLHRVVAAINNTIGRGPRGRQVGGT